MLPGDNMVNLKRKLSYPRSMRQYSQHEPARSRTSSISSRSMRQLRWLLSLAADRLRVCLAFNFKSDNTWPARS